MLQTIMKCLQLFSNPSLISYRLSDSKGDHKKHKKDKSPFSMFKKSKRDHSPGGGHHQVPAKITVTGSDYEYTESEVSEEMGGQVNKCFEYMA